MLAFYADPLRLAVRRGARAAARAVVRIANLDETPAPGMEDPRELGHGDAGWVQVLDVEGQRVRGRGRLTLRSEGIRANGVPAFDAQLESFVPADGPALAVGDVLLLAENANEYYPATVRAIDAEGSVISADWMAEELPATLRELGGE